MPEFLGSSSEVSTCRQYIIYDTPAKTNLLDSTFIDPTISAENHYEQNNLLRQVILSHNIRNQCGHLNPFAVFMIDGFCLENFLKAIVDETGHGEAHLYVMYRVRFSNTGGETTPWIYWTPQGSSITLTVNNLWVEPYCHKLSVMSQFHLNVEIGVSRVGGRQYFFKNF